MSSNSLQSTLTLHYWGIDQLIPYARNPRKNDPAVGRMVASIREFGFKIPILARSDGEVVDGHLRLKAARQLGLAEVPVLLCDEWSPVQVKAFRLMVNRSASWADWDLKLLGLELQDIKALDFDVQLTGFNPVEIDRFLAPLTPEEKADQIPESPADPVSRRGDLWRCGKHRILCGDAISPEDVARLLADEVPLLMVTDPPYGVEYDPLWREQAGLGKQRQTGRVANDHVVDWTAAYRLFPGDIAYIWHAGIHAAEVAAGIADAGFAIRSQIIWAKHHFVMSRGHYHWQHEPCWYAVRQGHPARWRGDRTQSTLWQVANLNPFGGTAAEDSISGHGTQKPVELMRRHSEPHRIRRTDL
jgi:hypothetical protein